MRRSVPLFQHRQSAAERSRRAEKRQANDEIGLSQADLDRFEHLLTLKSSQLYGSEDCGTLRQLTTPEAISYLAEELGENATKGVLHSVTNVRLLQGDIAEAWREDNAEYATLAMRLFERRRACRSHDRARLVEGDDRHASETTRDLDLRAQARLGLEAFRHQGTELHHA